MKRISTLLVALLVSGAALQAQIRYAEEVFSDADIVDTMNVAYGANFNPYINPAMVGGQTQVQPLQCDVYLPSPLVDTVSKRPVIIYIHTGSFLPQSITNSCTGSKEDSAAVRICRKFARHGFVTISASYRLGWLANSIDLDLRRGTNLLAVYYSIQDIKTLVRFLNVTSALGNPLQIDTDNIILLGQGSGGYTSLAYASLDEYDEVTAPAKFQYQG
jgi:acetyl esterase/lipase